MVIKIRYVKYLVSIFFEPFQEQQQFDKAKIAISNNICSNLRVELRRRPGRGRENCLSILFTLL